MVLLGIGAYLLLKKSGGGLFGMDGGETYGEARRRLEGLDDDLDGLDGRRRRGHTAMQYAYGRSNGFDGLGGLGVHAAQKIAYNQTGLKATNKRFIANLKEVRNKALQQLRIEQRGGRGSGKNTVESLQQAIQSIDNALECVKSGGSAYDCGQNLSYSIKG